MKFYSRKSNVYCIIMHLVRSISMYVHCCQLPNTIKNWQNKAIEHELIPPVSHKYTCMYIQQNV